MDNKTKSRIRKFYDSLTTEKETFTLPLNEILVARFLHIKEIDGEIVGIAGIELNRNRFFEVVRRDFQNQGIGQELLKAVINSSRSELDYLELHVFESNLQAIHIYKKHGYKVISTNVSIDGIRSYFMILPFNIKGAIYTLIMLIYLNIPKLGIIKKQIKKFWRGRV